MDEKVIFEIRINYPNGKWTRQEFACEADARDRAEHLSSVHKCIVNLNEISRREICTYWKEMESAR